MIPRGTVYGDAYADSLMAMTLQSKALMYALIVVALGHARALQGKREQRSPIETHLAGQTIKLLNEQMADPASVATVANIWAIGCVSHFSDIAPLRTGKLPRQSFMKELQDVQILGATRTDRAQYHGFLRLLEMAGGVHAIREPGVAATIS